MIDLEYIHFKDKDTFHNWLQNNYEINSGIWVIFYKKQTNIECIKYDDALDEALCFGWIDSIIKKIDNDKYARKFTPRINLSNWSNINKIKIIELIKCGRMQEAGLKKIDAYLKTGKIDWENEVIVQKKEEAIDIPVFIQKSFSQNEPALINFNKLSDLYKRQYILWITNAKRTETIQNRLNESIALLKDNKKLGLK
jgi:uncharacterized protein YdeI (YjbR/CyaY-like superfamily)